MKKLLLLLFFAVTFCNGTYAQNPLFIQGPEGYGLASPYTDRGMIPLFKDGNDLYATTRKLDPANNVLRNYVVRINLTNDSMYVFSGISLSGTATLYSPRNFTVYQDYVFFSCASKLYRITKSTNQIIEFLSDCDHYFISGNILLHDYWNSSATYARNLTTNTFAQVKATDDRSIIEIGSMYEYDNSIYFWGTVSLYTGRKNGIFRYNKSTGVVTSFMYVSLPNGYSEMYQGRTEVTRINNNLVYLIKDTDYKYRYISINLETQTLNSTFTFNTNTVYDTGLTEPFIIGNRIYVNKEGVTYSSDGVTAPEPTTLGFSGGGFGQIYNEYINYNDAVYTIRNTEAYGSEVWKTDGTVAGTQLLADLNPGPEGAFYTSGYAKVFGNYLYFATTQYIPGILYRCGGTAETTLPITTPGEFTSVSGFNSYGDYIYFYGQKTDGPNGLYKLNPEEFLAVTAQKQKILYIYPNPASDMLHISEPVEKATVYDMAGRLVSEHDNVTQLSLATLQAGYYLLKTTTGNNKVQNFKFIVK